MLDEIEELNLVLEHYAITWGLKVTSRAATVSPWSEWGLRPVAH
jgi:[phosphatase 2A protein]-leucine-carboxy methyltransferase